MGVPRLGAPDDIVTVSSRLGIRIVFVCRRTPPSREEFERYSVQFTHVEYLPSAVQFPAFGSRLVSFGSIGGIEMGNPHLMPILSVEKLLLDKALAVVALLVLSPFFSMYADADARLQRILSDDPAAAAEWKANFKLAHDPRVTPLGNLLRRTSIDELPQIFNVFAGDMSLVGPRPIVKEEVAYYGDDYRIFASVPPGVTGLWQASGRSDTDYERRVALDVQYVLNWSPWMDIWIIIKTAISVATMRGAR